MEKAVVTLSQAKKRLEELVSRAQAGEDIFISRRRRVVAVMSSLAKDACGQARCLGLGEGYFVVPEAFAEPLCLPCGKRWSRPWSRGSAAFDRGALAVRHRTPPARLSAEGGPAAIHGALPVGARART